MVAGQLPVDGRFDGQPTGQHAHLIDVGPAGGSDWASPAARAVVLTLLAVDGAFCAIATALFLPSYLGALPFPISAVIGGLVNAALVWAATHWTDSLRVAALPLWTWLATVAVMTLGGPGDDMIFAGRGVMAYAVLAMIVVGSAPPARVLWRRHRGVTRMAVSAGQA